ncbi:hypothetical protein ACFX1Q_006897 [Malus domestica]
MLSFTIAATKGTLNLLLSPLALVSGCIGCGLRVILLRNHLRGEVNVFSSLPLLLQCFLGSHLSRQPISMATLKYNSTLYLAKYSEKVVVPTAVMQLGLTAVCSSYYDQKAKTEEALMVDTFGQRYTDYASKGRYKFVPSIC